MNLNKPVMLLTVGMSVLLATGCGVRMNEGKDLHEVNRVEAKVIKMKLKYIQDQYGNCFAVLNNHTYGLKSTFTIAAVNCNTLRKPTIKTTAPVTYAYNISGSA